MSLAAVTVEVSDWDNVYSHLLQYKPQYGNMHLRQVRTVGGKRELRYLHMLKAQSKRPQIDGMISGPDIFCNYNLIKNRSGLIQLNVLSEVGTSKEKDRLGHRFLLEILGRVHSEKNATDTPFANYSKGEFYLRRSEPGMGSGHANCQAALNANKLDQIFVDHLEPWQFSLLHP